MKIEIWSDYVCPFCYIGKRCLEQALDLFDHREKVEVVFRSFQLNPTSPTYTNKDIHTVLAEKFGVSYDQAKKMNEQVGRQAEEVGLTYHFDTMKPTNTLDAHRVSHYAKSLGKDKELTERLLKAYFTDSLHIGDHETLASIAEEIGLDRTEVKQLLESDQYKKEVDADQQEASRLGITGVPFFVFNEKYAVQGAQPTEVFSEVLQKVWEEENEKIKIQILQSNSNNNGNENCSDGSCNI
jgi:predicted DsbA family dithiol-disulfide isomerase